jgi:Putative adhesin
MTTWTIHQPQRLAFDRVRRLGVRIVAGGVSVVGSDDPPTLEVAELRRGPLRVRHDGDELEVVHELPRWPGSGWLLGGRQRAVISLAVPRDCQVKLRVFSAGLMVSGLLARVVARTVSGEITLARLGGEVQADTVSGAVQAHGVAGDLWAHTISGDLTLVEGAGGAVHAQTVSGSVTLDLNAAAERDIRLSSISGDLTVRLPEASDLQVQVQSTSGQVASAFAELRREGRPALRTLSGRLGAGTGRLRANTTSGHVALLRREPEMPR